MTQGSAIGRSIRRLDGGEKVTGVTRFAGDIQLPRMAHARLILSRHVHARIARIDGRRAAALPDVLGVFASAVADATGRRFAELPIPSQAIVRARAGKSAPSRTPSAGRRAHPAP